MSLLFCTTSCNYKIESELLEMLTQAEEIAGTRDYTHKGAKSNVYLS